MYVQSSHPAVVVMHSISHSSLPRFGAHPKSFFTFLPNPNPVINHDSKTTLQFISLPKSINSSDSYTSLPVTDGELEDAPLDVIDDDDVDVEIIQLGKNARRITCRIGVDANLESVWNVLTDYERLADFIPGLAVCQLLEKSGNRVRLFQIGQQNLAFGLKFNAKGIVDCYEKDLERASFGKRRDIEFKMIEGDFQVFEGKWSIEEMDNESNEVTKTSIKQGFQTILSYIVEVKPKLWLPVRLVEGRLCREIRLNLVCIKLQAQKAV